MVSLSRQSPDKEATSATGHVYFLVLRVLGTVPVAHVLGGYIFYFMDRLTKLFANVISSSSAVSQSWCRVSVDPRCMGE